MNPGPPLHTIQKSLTKWQRRKKKGVWETDEEYIARLERQGKEYVLVAACHDRTTNEEPDPNRRIAHADSMVRHRHEIIAELGIHVKEEEDDETDPRP